MATILRALPDIVLVDRKAGQKNGTANIYYNQDNGNRLFLWERVVGEPWIPIDLTPPRILSSLSGNPEVDGTFSKILKPGQVYEVVLYRYEWIDPNVVNPTGKEDNPDASVRVVALLKDPEKTTLIESQDKTVGGTWFRKVVTTTVPTTFLLQVGNIKPSTDTQGNEFFLKPLASVFDPANTHHDQQVDPLLPGNDLFYLARVVDDEGNWQIINDEFRTKQRKVTIDFTELHIINDGAAGDTTGEFHIWVMEGDNTVRDYFFGDVDNFDISDSPDPGDEEQEWIPLKPPRCPTFVLGPKDTTQTTYDIGILTRGLVFRSLGSNDYAMNFFGDPDNLKKNVLRQAKFQFPTGGGENVQNVPFVVRATPQVTGAEIEYDVRALFTVEYT